MADARVREAQGLVLSPGLGDPAADAARGELPAPMPPPPPAAPLPPRGGGKGGKAVQISEERAMQRRSEPLCYLAIARLFQALKEHDALPASAIEYLKRVVDG